MKTCQHCGHEIIGKRRPDTLYCDSFCRNKAANSRRDKAKRAEYMRQYERKKIADKPKRDAERAKKIIQQLKREAKSAREVMTLRTITERYRYPEPSPFLGAQYNIY